jgi:hypothetical protein
VWCDFDDSDSDGIFEVEIPVTCTYAIFLSVTIDSENNWDNRGELARTGDLTLPTDEKNCYNGYTETWGTVAEVKAYDPDAIYAEDGWVYLKPNSNWTQSNAWFAIYFFKNGGSTEWVKMEKVNGTPYYGAKLPDTSKYTHLIFCRMDSGKSALDWGSKWNQSGDLPVSNVNSNNCCSINSGQWDCGTNVKWSTVDILNK